jgi:hypothetical protein
MPKITHGNEKSRMNAAIAKALLFLKNYPLGELVVHSTCIYNV